MFVCCECFVFSGRGLCDELITRPEESYRLWCVVVCDLEKHQEWGGHDPRWVAAPQQKKNTDSILVDSVHTALCQAESSSLPTQCVYAFRMVPTNSHYLLVHHLQIGLSNGGTQYLPWGTQCVCMYNWD